MNGSIFQLILIRYSVGESDEDGKVLGDGWSSDFFRKGISPNFSREAMEWLGPSNRRLEMRESV